MVPQLTQLFQYETRVDTGEDVRALREGAVAAAGETVAGDANNVIARAVNAVRGNAAEELDEDGDRGVVEDRGAGRAVVGTATVYTQGGGELGFVYDGSGHDRDE